MTKTSVTNENFLKGAYYPDINPEEWILWNKIDFPYWLFHTFDYDTISSTQDLYNYQTFVKDYLQFNSPYRGLVLYHGLGVGKTRTAIATAETLRDHMSVFVLLPAALKSNFIRELQKSSHPFIRTNQYWKLKSYDSSFSHLKLPKSLIEKNKGIWIPIFGKQSNYDTLSDQEKQDLNAQIEFSIHHRYKFIHYNGIKKAGIDKLVQETGVLNIFDNSFVIIDEVHNFISSVMGGSQTGPNAILYKKLMNASNVKMLLLSGTPIINHPIELAYLANLVHGYSEMYKLAYLQKSKFDQDKVATYFRNHKFIDYSSVKYDTREINFSLVPNGFEISNASNKKVVRCQSPYDKNNIIKDIIQNIKQMGVVTDVERLKLKRFTLLPENEETFEEYFINYDATDSESAIKNPMLLSRRLQGLFSFYESYNHEDFPAQLNHKYYKIPMSDEQFSKYVVVRQEEIERERRAKSRNHKNSDKVKKNESSVYRTFSRALCNWVFPPGIPRPTPTSKQIIDEVDLPLEDLKELEDIIAEDLHEKKEQEQKGGAKKQQDTYLLKIAQALSLLKKKENEYLTGEGLKKYGPKYFYLLNNIISINERTPGTSLIYSVFRSVEGLKILTMVLDANGWAEMKLQKNNNHEWVFDVEENDFGKPKYIQFLGGQDEQTKILLDIYNSDFDQIPPGLYKQLQSMYPHINFTTEKNYQGKIINALMITKSGSEGISLKNVRQVHILEPYWNEVRIKQVIGRAIRAKSHLALAQHERTVDVYIYLIKLTSKQADDTLMKTNDKGLTSDEYVLNNARKKALVNNQLQKLIRNASVDCFINSHKHGDKVKCFQVPLQMSNSERTMIRPGDITNDYKNAELEDMKRKVIQKEHFKKFQYNSKLYPRRSFVYNTLTKEVYLEEDVYNPAKEPIAVITKFNDEGIPISIRFKRTKT